MFIVSAKLSVNAALKTIETILRSLRVIAGISRPRARRTPPRTAEYIISMFQQSFSIIYLRLKSKEFLSMVRFAVECRGCTTTTPVGAAAEIDHGGTVGVSSLENGCSPFASFDLYFPLFVARDLTKAMQVFVFWMFFGTLQLFLH